MKYQIRAIALASLSLSLMLGLGEGADAKYRPSGVGRYGGTTTTTGTRGVCGGSLNQGGALTAIAPLSHVGQTASSTPTLTWFVPGNQTYGMEVVIFQEKASDRTQREVVWRSGEFAGKLGLMQLTVLKKLPVGQYIWQVSMFCNPLKPATTQIAEAPIAVIAIAPSVLASIESAPTPEERVDRAAAAELWYDALREAQSASNPRLVRELMADLQTLEAEAKTSPTQSQRLSMVLQALQR